MTPQELYSAFLSCRDLPTLSIAAARRLLDQSRSALLAAGRTLKSATAGTPAEAKAAILEAHRQLQVAGLAEGSAQVYCGPQSNEPQLFNGLDPAAAAELFQEHRRRSGRPRSRELDQAVAALAAPATTASAGSAVSRVAALAAASERQGKDVADLKRRVGVVAAKLAPLKKAPATPAAPNPLADFSNSKLGWLAGHRSATEADKATARAELARRGATLSPSGIVSQSTRRQPK